MRKNFLISTGGSGGHVIPATILHDHLSKENNILISIDKRGIKYLNNSLYKLKIVNTPKLNNYLLLPINLILVIFLTIKSFLLLKNEKIEKVFSTGGYMSLPLILAARILSLDIYLIEPNQILGRANKFFLNFCKKIFCYSDTIKNFPQKLKNKIIVIYPLVKKDIYEKSLFIKESKKFTILIVGGSQGAKIFDQRLKDSIVKISKKNSIKVIHQTNEKNISYLKNYYNDNNIENIIFSFNKNFNEILVNSDLCITRAGASTLAELSILNKPFIAVPLPTSKDNHQLENAIFYEEKNCCWVIEQKFLEEKIDDLLNDILENKTNYLNKKENLKKLNYQNSWINVNQKILKILNEN